MRRGTHRELLLFVIRRVAAAIVVVWVVVSITFVIVRVLPGNPAYLLAGSQATQETITQFERQLGLDQPVYTQYWFFLRDLGSLNLSRSLQTGHSVVSDLRARLPATLELTLTALLVGCVIGVGLGVLTAVREEGILPRAARVLTTAGAAIPEFWLGLVLILVFYTYLGVAPAPIGRLSVLGNPPDGPTGFLLVDSVLARDLSTLADALGHLVLPVAALSFLAIPTIARVTRATMRTTLAQDFVLTARANGDRGARLYLFRVLPVAFPPILTSIALLSGYLLAGDFLLEKVFAWPGVGLYTVNAVQVGDFPAIQGGVLLSAGIWVTVILLADILTALIDPRSRILT